MPSASAPASSANLGPGFDILALALELRCTVTARPFERWQVEHVGPERLAGEDDIVLEAARRAAGEGTALALTVDNHIPIGRGLGSSAAAATAGAAAALRAVGADPAPETVFELVAEIEDHPDNAAAAVYGGLVLCTPGGAVHRLSIHPSLVPVVAIPDRPLSTSKARSVLADAFPRPLVVRSLGRVAALVAGLISADSDYLGAACDDELHEAPRNQYRPEVAELIDVARGAGALHACWSGAGPSVLALAPEGAVESVIIALQATAHPGTVRRFEVAKVGLK